MKAEADYEGQTRSVDYFLLPASAAGEIPAPSEDALKAFYNDRKSSYRAPEYRAMNILALEPETIANPAEVSDADAEAAYEKIAGKDPRLGAPEKRDLQQIVFPNEADADAAEAKIKAGASFDDIVKERGLKAEDTDLGETTKDAMLDKAEADAVFALAAGRRQRRAQEPVRSGHRSREGHNAIDDQAVRGGRGRGEDGRSPLRAPATRSRRLHDKIEDARVSGKSLIEAAKAVGLDRAIHPRGRRPRATTPKARRSTCRTRPELLRAAFASDVGVDEAPLNTKDGGFVWFMITKIDPAHDLTFEEAKPEVEKEQRAEEVDKALAGKADDLVKQISAGASVADVAKSAGVEAKSAADIHRDEQTSLPEAVVAAIFRQPADGAGSAATPDGRVVFKITADRTPPVEFADPRVKEMASRLDASTRESLLDQYVAALRRSLGVVVHQEVLQSAEGS